MTEEAFDGAAAERLFAQQERLAKNLEQTVEKLHRDTGLVAFAATGITMLNSVGVGLPVGKAQPMVEAIDEYMAGLAALRSALIGSQQHSG